MRSNAFTKKEDDYIVRIVKKAEKKGEKMAVSTITKRLNSRRTAEKTRTRPAVNHRVQILIRKERISADSIIKGKEKVSYTKKEDRVLVKVMSEAVTNKITLTMRELTKALHKARVSPIKRTEPSVRARVLNVLLAKNSKNLAAIHSETIKKAM